MMQSLGKLVRASSKTRLILSAEHLRRLPFKSVTAAEHSALLCEMDYNPVSIYDDIVETRAHEVGHNASFRFLLT